MLCDESKKTQLLNVEILSSYSHYSSFTIHNVKVERSSGLTIDDLQKVDGCSESTIPDLHFTVYKGEDCSESQLFTIYNSSPIAFSSSFAEPANSEAAR